MAIAAAGCLALWSQPDFDTKLSIPFLKGVRPDLGPLYIPFAVFVIVGASNAVNLTDGLDGLAIGPTITASLTYLIFAYAAGNFVIARYLQIPFVPGAGELAVFCAGMMGAALGFLWYNAYPAEVRVVASLALEGRRSARSVSTARGPTIPTTSCRMSTGASCVATVSSARG